MKSGNQEFEIVYSKSEMEDTLQLLKAKGYHEKDIHLLANDKEIVESAGKSGVSADRANSFSNRFKSFLSGKDIVRKELNRFNLSKERTDDYERRIEKGAVLLYTDGDAATPEDEHFSSLDDSNAPMDLEAETAGTPDSNPVSRYTEKHHDSDEIYAREVSREDQHARAGEHDRFQDSRLKGDEIHPTGGLNKEEQTRQRKEMDHEPGLQNKDSQDELLREKGVNRRQDEPSPGVDPNLGPAPFGRDFEESNNEQGNNPDEHRDVQHKRDSDNTTPPTPRLF
ncbi:MAG: general stress protein [Planococcus sp. (in: firmicutes)]|uniref:general stress protein n=1 Tax=Planococcus halocryophilus TaxID=1215089 RepID=UPI001F0EB110|nr:general stress protein [Planococcus halocryophilus]MCH4824760.1 general stress protein [Planococcus halocryophilus]